MLGNYGQHFNVDTVELVKATPSSSLLRNKSNDTALDINETPHIYKKVIFIFKVSSVQCALVCLLPVRISNFAPFILLPLCVNETNAPIVIGQSYNEQPRFFSYIIHLINRYLSQSTVHATHGFVVQTLGAVHHNDIIAKCFAKIFHSFSPACTSRALGTTTAVQMKSSRQCHVTSVRCNHR